MAATGKAPSKGLETYRSKRSPGHTPEPFGPGVDVGAKLFVVQKHSARRLHYDFRLALGGVLKSWAVPKGPSRDPADKRLAVLTEDHPLEYADFEGIIPEGNYGAGAVIVWDRGAFVPDNDLEAGLETGKLLFELKGYKLRGMWTLVKIKKSKNEWLLIKERDAWAVTDGGAQFSERSVFSGLTVEELKAGHGRTKPVCDTLATLRAPRRSVRARDVELMLAQTAEAPFSDPQWMYELKYDGYRLLAAREDAAPVLRSRNGNDLTDTFPEIARAVSALPFDAVVLDGEVAVLDEDGRPSFQRLQKRGRMSRRSEIQRAAIELPATFFAFDLLAFEGYDLRPLALHERKALLREILPGAGVLRYADHIEAQGERFYDEVHRMGLEGIIAKRRDSPYQAGRSANWLKIRADRTDDFAIVGFSDPKGSRGGFGALHLAWYDAGQLTYAGRAGTGFSGNQLDEIRKLLEPSRRPDPPCTGPVPKGPDHHWVDSGLVCEVRYKQWTDDGLLRHPVFVRLRDDKPVQECVRPGGEPVPVAAPADGEPMDERVVPYSNLDKVFWPAEGYTKGDLIAYYDAVGAWLMPYLEDRPIVLTRYPDGIEGKSFFQKDAPEWVPEWVRTETVWSEDSNKDIRYFVCESVEALLYVINLGAIPLHVWSSRLPRLERPDWCVLDLDPKEAPFTHVVKVARVIRDLCAEIDLPCFVKTSGSSGLHILIPLGGQCTYEQSRTLGQLLARVTAADLPEIATTARNLAARRGRVYIDFVQNGYGRLIAAPLCVRPLPGAPVSMPLRWREVNDKLDIAKHTIRTAPARLRRMKEDPLRAVLTMEPDLVGALQKLAAIKGQ